MSDPRADDVFLDAQEEITPRRSGRKRRSTAGSTGQCTNKKSRSGKNMPLQRSPGKNGGPAGATREGPTATEGDQEAAPGDSKAFWTKMGGMLGGLGGRLRQETQDVKDQLGRAIGDLGTRVERIEKRLDGLADEVNQLVDKRIAGSMLPNGVPPPGGAQVGVLECVPDLQ